MEINQNHVAAWYKASGGCPYGKKSGVMVPGNAIGHRKCVLAPLAALEVGLEVPGSNGMVIFWWFKPMLSLVPILDKIGIFWA